ncbi:uncharacterized protein BYT42DRAFT_553640 [Radiomyces spectabilis]|uniref:uncharacterized protein n=1 Tax=Radiomyces spectabilis TaxID=64574 RepID=UPI00221FBE81|nr:uncharacterized protein BYT42DRAFT_553640 [Radiomyces spectabilis]KAI8394186.1 hypothetical protein BYT42DRAFT_553640 [Radiomyces spectabilis]
MTKRKSYFHALFKSRKNSLHFKPKSYSIYLTSVIFNDRGELLTTSAGQLPTWPILLNNKSAYHDFTTSSDRFAKVMEESLSWYALGCTDASEAFGTLAYVNVSGQFSDRQENNGGEDDDFYKRFLAAVRHLSEILGCHLGELFHHIVEYDRPAFKLLVTLQPASASYQIRGNLHWQSPCKLHSVFRLRHTPSNIWTSVRDIVQEQSCQLDDGLYLALFCVRASSRCGMRVLLPKHREQMLPCVRLRRDARLTSQEWDWFQKLSKYGEKDLEHEYDFLTKEMQQMYRQQQKELRHQAQPFERLLMQGCSDLQGMTGIDVQLKDIFFEDTVCIQRSPSGVCHSAEMSSDITDEDVMETSQLSLPVPPSSRHFTDTDDELEDMHVCKEKEKMTLVDMFSREARRHRHASWDKPVSVRLLVIVKPIETEPCVLLPRPDYDFYPCALHNLLHQQVYDLRSPRDKIDASQFRHSYAHSISDLPTLSQPVEPQLDDRNARSLTDRRGSYGHGWDYIYPVDGNNSQPSDTQSADDHSLLLPKNGTPNTESSLITPASSLTLLEEPNVFKRKPTRSFEGKKALKASWVGRLVDFNHRRQTRLYSSVYLTSDEHHDLLETVHQRFSYHFGA